MLESHQKEARLRGHRSQDPIPSRVVDLFQVSIHLRVAYGIKRTMIATLRESLPVGLKKVSMKEKKPPLA
jgi:hypothetical protein